MAEPQEGGNLLEPEHLFGHVEDQTYFHVPRMFAPGGHLEIRQVRELPAEPLIHGNTGLPVIDQTLARFDLVITKFMVIELLGAVLLVAIFVPFALRLSQTAAPRGRWTNLLEVFLLFIRDQVARPAIGHEADRFLPFLWTTFFFILICNLLGLVPWLGSPTGALGATGALAIVTLVVVVGTGMRKLGATGFWKAQVPHVDVPFGMGYAIKPMLFAIEVFGLLIRHFVLSVRLMANMMAGHLVLFVMVAFIGVIYAFTDSYAHPLFWLVTGSSVLGAVAVSLLELFVAFLQAYIFTFLSALFIGMAVHPH